jgi:hypothetical protein
MKNHYQRMLRAYLALVEGFTVPRNRIGLATFRVFSGCLILVEYLLNYRQRHFLFGPNGVHPWDMLVANYEGFSLYRISNSPICFELLFHLGIAVTIVWVLGFRTRLFTPLTYIFWWSLRQTNPFLWDGGDNLLQIVLVFACFADLSPVRRNSTPPGPNLQRSLLSSVAGLIHNGALLAMAVQVCLLYGVSALSKVQGEVWQNGTALYYALWPEQFSFPGVSELLFRDARLLALATHATVFFQVSFPFLFCLNRRTRHIAVAIAVTFHLGIAAVMGLFTFAGFMIAADLALVSDSAYLRLADLASAFAARIWGRARRGVEAQSAAKLSAG